MAKSQPEPSLCSECGITRSYVKLTDSEPLAVYRRQQCGCDILRSKELERQKAEDCALMANKLIAEAVSGLHLPMRCRRARFELMTVDGANRRAVKIARVRAADITDGKGLYFYGTPGVGKTFIMCAMLHEVAASGQLLVKRDYPSPWSTMRAVFLSVPEWLERCRQAYGDKVIANEAGEAMHALIVGIDDLGVENPTEWVKERIYTLINHRYECGLPTLITSNCDLGELGKRLTARIASRIAEMCDQVPMSGKDRRLSACREVEVAGPSRRGRTEE